jgi:hypothetical protein
MSTTSAVGRRVPSMVVTETSADIEEMIARVHCAARSNPRSRKIAVIQSN